MRIVWVPGVPGSCSPLKIEVQGGFSGQAGVAQNHFLHPTALPCSLSSFVLPFLHPISGVNSKMPGATLQRTSENPKILFVLSSGCVEDDQGDEI